MNARALPDAKGQVRALEGHPVHPPGMTYTIFEGTSEIQRLIIARAISGMHIR